MTPLPLPEPLAAFFAAQGQAPGALAGCFTADGVVQDEGQTYQGREAIAAWHARARTQTSFVSTPHTLERQGAADVIVTSRVEGNFPGSPVDLRYRFRMAGGLIAALEVAP